MRIAITTDAHFPYPSIVAHTASHVHGVAEGPAVRWGSLLAEPVFPYGEDLLQFIWEQRLFDGKALTTTDGTLVEVCRPGRIQRNSGPDLADADLRIGGQRWAGSVEVHQRSSEWTAHGHHKDPAYEGVVLHVVHTHDAEVHTLAGHRLPTVELRSRISSAQLATYQQLMQARGFVPCARLLGQFDQARAGIWLERVLVERLEHRSCAVAALYRQLRGDAAAMLYHLIARAFGMHVNADPFSMLAHALPLNVLLRYRDDALRTEALLFGQAGLLQVDLVDAHPRSLQREFTLLAAKHGLRPLPTAAWKFGRMRPANLPTLRIAQLAQLLMSWGDTLADLLDLTDVNALYKALDVEAGAYWTSHYVFDQESAHRPKRLGRAGVQHLIINAVVPALFTLGKLQGHEAWCERAMNFLEHLPPERNSMLEGWKELGLEVDTAARGQALMELKRSYCAARRCLTCAIGNHLLRRSVSE
ncbi:MAG: DUF2851 family protein [Flavobacteriales bacterium]|nr:DUF2851 family protein [Flavobacteriales bacterium]